MSVNKGRIWPGVLGIQCYSMCRGGTQALECWVQNQIYFLWTCPKDNSSLSQNLSSYDRYDVTSFDILSSPKLWLSISGALWNVVRILPEQELRSLFSTHWAENSLKFIKQGLALKWSQRATQISGLNKDFFNSTLKPWRGSISFHPVILFTFLRVNYR